MVRMMVSKIIDVGSSPAILNRVYGREVNAVVC